MCTVSLSDLLTPWEVIEKRLDAAASADFVMSLYNPKSRQRKSNFSKAIEIIRKYKDDSVPVALVKNALRESDQDYVVTTLGEVMDYNDWVDMSTTILITTNDSRIWDSPHGKRVITPRGYHRKYDY
jgi:precorrin-3B C17-methyltransferase